ncbi:tRNA-modifying protein YgfZ [Marinomonas agarivorans]|nr:tRNA-modifying protein YgfZ [Marinomonas agarivorans]
MHHDMVTKTLTHLKKYAVFFKVDMQDVSDSYEYHHLFTDGSKLSATEPLATHSANNNTAIAISQSSSHPSSQSPICETLLVTQKGQPLAEVFEQFGSLFELPFELPFECKPDSTDKRLQVNNELQGLSIFNGQALIRQATSEKFVPQMLNMQFTHGISFQKGCYTGQEIVARMQYRGNLKKRVHLLSYSLDGTDNMTDKDAPALTTFTNREGRAVADIVVSSVLFNQVFCLAVIGDQDVQAPIFCNDKPLKKWPLPYESELES